MKESNPNTYKKKVRELSPEEERKRFDCMLKIAQEYLFELHNGESCCIYTSEIMRILIKISPDIHVEWNKVEKCYLCWK